MQLKATKFIRNGVIHCKAEVEEVFPLLCPKREEEWIPGRECETKQIKRGLWRNLMKNNFGRALLGVAIVCLLSPRAWAGEGGLVPVVNGLQQVAQVNYAIHILAMLLVGFGFLMVFVRKYGYGATTGTYLVVATGLPLYVLLRASGVLCGEPIAPSTIKALLYAEFAVASALIAMGAVLGRL